MVWVLAPRPDARSSCRTPARHGIGWNHDTRSYLALAAYVWMSVCMVAAWAVYRLDRAQRVAWLIGPLIFVVGYGPLLCAITFAAYVAELRDKSHHLGEDREDRQGRAVAA